ncbi:dihydrofolate reductase family protein [Deinococcus peraridilitoris]|uniref:Dihydrofolate reductase n=1 Tax=Deinococcus peraridilitoris (strain DSM 19664 / LMG 22246 / CIP 109416 / KR-200) TaxID=937777 RepID=L0A7A9_DEIPD|nr:dihydrofolate reductase family protein [Deinococcus peraridilitoris]AFZ69748.1 dihydrofolate reductase [Deinococcus peraridilitoris DSM 19664]
MNQPRVSVFLGLSLDGYLARDDHNLDWLHTTLTPTDTPQDTGYTSFIATVDTLVIGRNTYDTVLNFDAWPYQGKHVVVLTSRPAESRHGETFFNGPLSTLLRELGEQGFRHVYLDGGIAVRQGLDEGLVDDLTLSWLPIILGSGRPLFHRGMSESRWSLTGSRVLENGLVQGQYQRADQSFYTPGGHSI